MIDELFARRHVSLVGALLLAGASSARHRSACCRRECSSAVAVVAVGVGDDDVRDRPSGGGCQDRGAMGFVFRTRIDDGQLVVPDEIGVGAAKRERARFGATRRTTPGAMGSGCP